MNPMQPNSPGQGPDQPDDSLIVPQVNTSQPPAETDLESLGSRLREAREARGWELADCAHALRLPLHMLRRLERNDYEDADSRVYLASYINKYGQHLGIDADVIQRELDRIKRVDPVLHTTGGISHSRFLLDRYVTAATYVVLTAVIMVPMIWMGVRGTLNRDISHLAPLDANPVAQQELMQTPAGDLVTTPTQHPTGVTTPLAAPAREPDQPLLASMAAFPSLGADPALATMTSKPTDTTRAGAHSLGLELSAASWVEVTDQDGNRLEYGLLPAGSNKTYHSDQSLDVRIGNVSGARVSI
ncbi:MAG: helix-turn-helix domain-containing protein, partial [Rhodanobacter sp.]